MLNHGMGEGQSPSPSIALKPCFPQVEDSQTLTFPFLGLPEEALGRVGVEGSGRTRQKVAHDPNSSSLTSPLIPSLNKYSLSSHYSQEYRTNITQANKPQDQGRTWVDRRNQQSLLRVGEEVRY
jgi:hypothetical protein